MHVSLVWAVAEGGLYLPNKHFVQEVLVEMAVKLDHVPAGQTDRVPIEQ